ncbi:hypothetical protein V501_04241 [Pseudogymnoascus sp. VKM F-4519 (FW-2642)]|nr:hypothetical protein V501_04241 [Pseudogymnoascus sp. VKM F-4519 (FW-2642)]
MTDSRHQTPDMVIAPRKHADSGHIRHTAGIGLYYSTLLYSTSLPLPSPPREINSGGLFTTPPPPAYYPPLKSRITLTGASPTTRGSSLPPPYLTLPLSDSVARYCCAPTNLFYV